MAEAIVSIAIVVERLDDLLIQKTISLHGVSNRVKLLQDELKLIQSLLKVADARQNERNNSVRQWVADIRDLAYDAEDIIERYALEVDSRKGGGKQNVLKRFACILGEAKAIFQTNSDIRNMTRRISTLNSRLQNYGIKFDSMESGGPSSLSERIREQRQTYAHVEHDHVVVGLEDNLKEVVACLTEEVKYKYRVVSICGMGGLGKTTLARKAYHHPQVKSHFECRAWVCISQRCQRRDVWEGVMTGLMISPSKEQRDEIRSMTDAELAQKLCETQQRKKCLVVLDDIWKVGDWNSLCAAFPMNNTDSRILLTSRNEDLALQVDPRGRLNRLKFLNDDNSRELLQNLAISWREDSEIKEEMRFLGNEMVIYCKGLPLAVIVLGGLLATKQTLEEWEQVQRNFKSYLHQQKDLGISMVLALSYDDLPSHLKLCFLYLAHFPKDFEIRTKELIHMWMAEGLILQMQHTGKETLEDVGERYLQELVQRCMVQVGKKSSVARIKTCCLHDLVRGFCVEKAKLEKFLNAININHESNEEIEAPIGVVRRVAITGGSSDPVRLGFILQSTSQKYFQLRSLLTFSVPLKDQKSMLRNFKYLRVFNLLMNREGSAVMDYPPEINSLIQLRFLCIRNTGVRSIPSLRNLKCLQTLDLRSTHEEVNVPSDVFRNMEHLRHLYLPRLSKVSGKLQLPNASKLQTLVNTPVFICDVKDPSAGFDEFGKNIMPSNLTFNSLSVLKIVQRRTLIQSSYDRRVDIIPIVTSCPNLYKLGLFGEIEKLPEHDKISPHLVQLKLIETRLEEDPMLTLEKLPNLKILHLRSLACTGKKMICSVRGFPILQSLILSHLDNLEEWLVEEGSLPSLCHLKIESCDNLRMVPEGLQFVTTLQKLEIIGMPMSFRDRLGESGQDFYKIRHVSSLQIQD